MHELSLAQNICDVVKPLVSSKHKLKSVVVECGPFCGVQSEALEYCFSIVAPAAGLGQAALEIKKLKAEASCPACGSCLDIDTMWATCNKCGHGPLTAKGGREFRVKEIELEEVDNV